MEVNQTDADYISQLKKYLSVNTIKLTPFYYLVFIDEENTITTNTAYSRTYDARGVTGEKGW